MIALLIILAVALTIGAAVVSAFELALFSLREHHVSALSRSDRKLRAILRLLLRDLDANRVRVLLLTSVLNLSLIVLVLFLFHSYTQTLAFTPRIFWALLSIIFAGDILPKLVALIAPGWVFRTFANPYLSLIPVLNPPLAKLQTAAAAIEKILVPTSFVPRPVSYTEDEYETLVDIHREEGSLRPIESEVIAEIVRLGNKTAKDCMTSRIDAFTAPSDISKAEFRKLLDGAGWWKVPVYRHSPDAITGVIDVRKALQNPGQPLAQATEPPVFVPETIMALSVFSDYLREPHSLVIVLDEYGGTQGVLTHEDIIQQIAGQSAPAQNGTEPEIQRLSENRLLASGSVRLDTLGEILGVDLEEEGLDTIGGLVFNRYGSLPRAGQRIDLGKIRLIVRKTSAKRIEELLIERPETS